MKHLCARIKRENFYCLPRLKIKNKQHCTTENFIIHWYRYKIGVMYINYNSVCLLLRNQQGKKSQCIAL